MIESNMTAKFLSVVQEVEAIVNHVHLEQPIAAQIGHTNPLGASASKLKTKGRQMEDMLAGRTEELNNTQNKNNNDSKSNNGVVAAAAAAVALSKTGESTEEGKAGVAGALQHLEGFERLAHLLTGSRCEFEGVHSANANERNTKSV